MVTAAVVVVHVLAWQATEFSPAALIAGWAGMADLLAESLPPDLSVLGKSLEAAVVTLYIGLLGTTFSIPFALVLALLASRATTSAAWAQQAARAVLSFLRSVPDVVFALIFVTAVGLGPFAGVLALVFHNTGESGPQIALHAVLPTVLPSLAGLLLHRLDVNVRSSLVLGLVGAGGNRLPDQPVDQAVPVRRDGHAHPRGAASRGCGRPGFCVRAQAARCVICWP